MGLSCEQPLAMICQSSPLPTSQTSPATLFLVLNAPANLFLENLEHFLALFFFVCLPCENEKWDGKQNESVKDK